MRQYSQQHHQKLQYQCKLYCEISAVARHSIIEYLSELDFVETSPTQVAHHGVGIADHLVRLLQFIGQHFGPAHGRSPFE